MPDWKPEQWHFTSEVRRVMAEHGLTVAQLADMVGLDHATVRAWEEGRCVTEKVSSLLELRDLGADFGHLDSWGARMRAAREEWRMTQGDLASMVGISRSFVSALEHEQHAAAPEVARSIELALGVAVPARRPPEMACGAWGRHLLDERTARGQTREEVALDAGLGSGAVFRTEQLEERPLMQRSAQAALRLVEYYSAWQHWWEWGALNVGQRLRMVRFYAGLSLRDVSRRAGCTAGHLCNVELGRVGVSAGLLGRLCEACRFRYDQIFESKRAPWR